MGKRLTEAPVTILATDVEGSTALHATRGDPAALAILRGCERMIRERVREHGGQTVGVQGDGITAAFSSPPRALDCALAIQEALEEQARRVPDDRVRVRIGLHTGMIPGPGIDHSGAVVSAATRICGRAAGGQILVSEVVRQLCAGHGGAAFEDRGRVALRGSPERRRLYRVTTGTGRRGVAPGERTPFVGREAERAELRTLVDRARRGQGALVLVGGEPGVGKSRLVEEAVAAALDRGMVAHTGHCYEARADQPYMPWVEIIEAAARRVRPAALLDTFGDAAPELARVAPELRRVAPRIPPPLPLPPDQQRRYTFATIAAHVGRVARRRPQCYVLEDLHWADDSTLLFVEHLAPQLEGIPLLVIGTFRDPRGDAPAEPARQLAALEAAGAHRITLRRHSDAEVAELLGALSGHTPPPEVAAAIHAETDGNAFFVEEVFRHFSGIGRLLDAGGRFRTDLRIGELDVPDNVRLVIDQRLDRLERTTRQLLGAAAVLGRRFDPALLTEVTGVDAGAVDAAAAEAALAGLVGPDPDRPELLWFSHELARQALLAGLSTARRQRHHLRAASALERLHASAPEVAAAEIAHHLVEAGPHAGADATATWLELAGDRALEATAFEEALRHLTRALALLPEGDPRRRAGLLLKVGLAQRSLSRWDDTVATWREALPILEELGDVEAVGRLCYELSYQLGWAFRVPESLAVAERGLAAPGLVGVPRARMLAVTAAALTMANRLGEALPRLEEARRLGAEHPDDAALAGEVGFVELFHRYSTMQLRLAWEPGRRAERVLRAAGASWHLAGVLAFLDVAAVFEGRFDVAGAIEAELHPLAARLGHQGAASVTRRNEFPRAAAMEADLAALARLSDTQAEAARAMGPGWIAYARTLRAILELWRGDWESACVSAREGTSHAVSPSWFGAHHGVHMMVLAHCGRGAEALAVLDSVRDHLPVPGGQNSIGPWMLAVFAAEAVGITGDVEAARTLHPLVVEALATGTVMRQLDGRLIETAAGMVAAAAGWHDDAQAHFETALRQATELPHLMEQPQVRHAYGRFLVERGERERARTLLAEAAAGYGAIGMPRHLETARALLAGEEVGGGRSVR